MCWVSHIAVMFLLSPTRRRLAVALLGALAVLYAQEFLSVHETTHLFDTDREQCEYAPLASAGTSGMLVAAPVLAAPLAMVQQYTSFAQSLVSRSQPAPQARGPPV